LVIKDFDNAFNAFLTSTERFEEYRKKLIEKSHVIFEEEHGKPSWIKERG